MFKSLINSVNPFVGYIKIGAAVLIALLIIGLCWQNKNLKSDLAKRDKTIIDNAVELGKWQQSNANQEALISKQNLSIDALATLAQAAQKSAAEAIEKAKPIVDARQSMKQANQKEVNSIPIELNTCEAAIERQKAILAGSLL